MLGSSGGERRNAFTALERVMQSEDVSRTDIGDVIEFERDDGRYTEAKCRNLPRPPAPKGSRRGSRSACRARVTEAAIVTSRCRRQWKWPDFCHTRRGQLKDDNQRKFIDDMVVATRHQMFLRYRLTPGRLGYLASIYIQNGGKT